MKTLLATLSLACLFPQDKPEAAHPKVDQAKVDEAIKTGCKFLISGGSGFGTFPHGQRHQPEALQAYGELILLTLLHSGYHDGNDPAVQAIAQYCLDREITSTYTASLGAMAFQKLDPRAYQKRIAQYAQFLVDNQCQNGQWDYGAPVPIDPTLGDVATGGAGKKREDVASGGGAPGASSSGGRKKSGKTEALPKIPVRKKQPGPPNGDNSNAQYAALGLRACLDAGIDVDPKVLHLARQWWVKSQNTDGGWGYNGNGEMGGADNTDGVSNTSYGSMTVGAVGGLCIYDYYMGVNYKGDPAVVKGLEWLVKNYDVQKNPKKTAFASLYYLYGLERVGMLYGTEKLGNYEWYPDGAEFLLAKQRPGGSWHAGDRVPKEAHVDTCFAILFLRRGTAPLKREAVATGGPQPGAPVANAPAPLQAGGLKGPAGVVDTVAPGWRLLNVNKGPTVRLLGDARGKSNVLITVPPNTSTHPTLRRAIEAKAGTRVLVTAGHHESSEWTLHVLANGQELLQKVVGPRTSDKGWVTVDVDLTTFAGKEALVELVMRPHSAGGVDEAYWADVKVLSN
ncbi:MAG TPA: prenyltransferase/squalene oxidase repeat-containing protein [Planctomycetota bacterium]|nr:prenyltransferase/squalene oxidase repeat-containing protein [Planctomycetota bacterium]